jgi:hypothetical protein
MLLSGAMTRAAWLVREWWLGRGGEPRGLEGGRRVRRWPLSVRVAFFAARLLVLSRMSDAFRDRDRDYESGLRAGKFLFVAWLYTVWEIHSLIAWIVRGRDPWWSVFRFRPA